MLQANKLAFSATAIAARLFIGGFSACGQCSGSKDFFKHQQPRYLPCACKILRRKAANINHPQTFICGKIFTELFGIFIKFYPYTGSKRLKAAELQEAWLLKGGQGR